LLLKEYDGNYRWIKGKYSNDKCITFNENLEAGEYYLIVMAEWREKHNREITVLLYSNNEFTQFDRVSYKP
jgi:hypothetical protein